jgi:hypothetical protein
MGGHDAGMYRHQGVIQSLESRCLLSTSVLIPGGPAGLTITCDGSNTEVVGASYDETFADTSVVVSFEDPHGLLAVGYLVNNTGSGSRFYRSGASRGLFDGQDPASTDLLIKSTYFGDADLTGSVNPTDYSFIDNGYAMALTGWVNGDFNYDAAVNATDYSLIDTTNAFAPGPW